MTALLVASRSPLARTLELALDEACGVPRGARVLIAVSGGSDSVALAVLSAALAQRRSPAPIEPIMGHVDHGLRPESCAEAAGVEQLAATLGVPFQSMRVQVTPSGHGISAAARDARYEALESMARTSGAEVVATAHHASDQAETILLALARGTGERGLQGMQASRPFGNGMRLVRPLLGVPPKALLELVAACGLAYVSDPGNDDTSSPRAFMRHEILPRLDGMFPGASGRIAGVADTLHDSGGDQEERSLRSWHRAALAALPPKERRSVLRKSAVALDPTVSGCSKRVWDSIANAITAETTALRRHTLSATLGVVVDSREVRFEVREA